jgi:hypothetical protein
LGKILFEYLKNFYFLGYSLNLNNLKFKLFQFNFKASVKDFLYGSAISGAFMGNNVLEVLIYNIDPGACTSLTGATDFTIALAQITVTNEDGGYFTCMGSGEVVSDPGIRNP